MAETAHVKYVFLDIVAFTRDRSVEAQSDLVAKLNHVVRQALGTLEAAEDRTILIPTGDGIAVALLDVASFDIHLRLGLEILRLVADHNGVTEDLMRQFQVRIGINENVDNLIQDINGKLNVAGSGISMAQRIMDQADGGQILLGQMVHETLHPREKYMQSFRPFQARGKHGVVFPVYQFVAENCPGLDTKVPSVFAPRQIGKPKFTKVVGYYTAHAVANRDFLLSQKSDPAMGCTAVILLHFLAHDSVEKSETPGHECPVLITEGSGLASFEEQYRYYDHTDYWVRARLADLLCEENLAPYAEYFEESLLLNGFAFVKPAGLRRLREDWPAIADEFGLSESKD